MEKNNTYIKKQANELLEEFKDTKATEKYDGAAKLLLSANGLLFITLIWKLMDAKGDYSWFAIVALIFFFLGALSSILRAIADYLSSSVENAPAQEKLAKFFIANKKDLKEADYLDYPALKLNARFHVWQKAVLKKTTGSSTVSYIAGVIVYSLLDFIFLLASAAFFTVGVISLIIAVL